MIRRLLKLSVRACQVGRTRLLWAWRLHALGKRSVLGRPLLVNNACAVAVGSRVTILHQFVLADLRPGLLLATARPFFSVFSATQLNQ